MPNLLSGGEMLPGEFTMLKRTSALLVAGLALSACDQPAGGNGYFDQVETPAVNTYEPVVLVPVAPAEPDMTAALTEAVETAIADSETAEAPAEAPVTVATADTATISTDDGTLNLNITSQEQQKIERDEAAVLLAQARAQYVVIEPGSLPEVVAGVNIALFARETTNALGEKVYRRAVIKNRFSATECSKFGSPDDAQRYFLANAGPQKDPLNLDPDGDGFACRWSPDYFRQLN